MAVEDGAFIGKLLGSLQTYILTLSGRENKIAPSSRASVQYLTGEVLKVYERTRKTRTTRNVQGAIMNRKLFHMQDGILQKIRDFVLGYAGVTRKSDWTWLSSFRQGQTLGLDEDCAKVFEDWRSSLYLEK
jgi:salicylate hydroxylase